MRNEVFTKNPNDTQKIDLLLSKVISVEKIVKNRHKNKIKYPNFKIKKYWRNKTWTNGMIEVYEALNNTYNQFDDELAKHINLDINWYKHNNSSNLGLYYASAKEIKLNVSWEKLNNHQETFYHELGHAWYFQLPIKFKKMTYENVWTLGWKTIKKYLEFQTGVKLSLFYKSKPFIRKHLGFYASKNITECFDELFKKSCLEAIKWFKQNEDPLVKSNAFRAINYFNNLLKKT